MHELEQLGLEPYVQEVQALRAIGPEGEGVVLKNLVARLPGHAGTRSVLLAAHYDSSPRAPGAGDDSAAVAALLETARALRAGPPRRNDVLLLLTDGEEQGMLGARGFIAEDKAAHQVGLVLNFDARGNSGPVIMFETSPRNATLVRTFARVVPYPVANSLTHTVYRWLPNYTDFTIFEKAGMPGFSFAMIDGFPAYHTALDTPENLSGASLQHQGSYALALAQHFGNLDLTAGELEADADLIYFNAWGNWLVCYDRRWAFLQAGLALAGFAVLVVAAYRRGWLQGWFTLRLVWAGFDSQIAQAMAATVVLAALAFVGGLLGIPNPLSAHGEHLGSTWVTLALWNVALAGTLLLYLPNRGVVPAWSTMIRLLLSWVVLCLLSCFFLPGASYLFTWPLLFALPGYLLHLTGTAEKPLTRPRKVVILLCGVPAVALLTQTAYLFLLALTPPRFPQMAVGLLIVLYLSFLTQGLLLPQLRHLVTWGWPDAKPAPQVDSTAKA